VPNDPNHQKTSGHQTTTLLEEEKERKFDAKHANEKTTFTDTLQVQY